mmetsp:Transcript_33220/g.105908  ORF Transcript_33220/g.105908 Transcript_33220/m.105908 type:complete len:210 (-) Transcript_33220:504-1133(-)
MSMVPQMRSSVAPRGSSTMGMRALPVGSVSPARNLSRQSGPMSLGSVGEELNMSPGTTSMSGRSSARPRTVTDLAVPRSPMMSTPPMLGSTTLSSRASFMSSWPTMREKGKTGFFTPVVAANTTAPRPDAAARTEAAGERAAALRKAAAARKAEPLRATAGWKATALADAAVTDDTFRQGVTRAELRVAAEVAICPGAGVMHSPATRIR